jgi:dihydropteroate synthase
VGEGEELRRLIPVLKKLKGKLDVPISIDTYKPNVAERALEHDAQIINDVSGLTWEPALAKVAMKSDAGLILSHMRGTPQTWATLPPMRDLIGGIATELEAAAHRARTSGVQMDRLVLDPGIGFGKRKEQNSEIIGRLAELQRRLTRPLLLGPSRKSFLAREEAAETEIATAAAVAAAVLGGAYIVRVHDVALMKAAIDVSDVIIASLPEPDTEEQARAAKRATAPERDREGRPRDWPPRPPQDRKVEERSRRDFSGPRTPRDEGHREGDQRPPRVYESRPPQSRPPRDRDAPSPRRTYGSKPAGPRPPQREGDERRGRPYGANAPGARPPQRGGEDRPPRKSYGPGRADSRPPRKSESGDRPRKPYGPPRGDARRGRPSGPDRPRGPRGGKPPRRG